KDAQRPQGNAVAGFDYIQVVVADGVAQHRGNQSPGAGGGAHPQNVVVAPLNVHIVGLHERIHNNIRPGAPVEDIAYNVQLVHDQVLDDLADGPNDVGGLTNLDGGVDDILILVPAGTAFLCQMN